MRYCLFHIFAIFSNGCFIYMIFLIMAEAAILDGQFVKNCNSFMLRFLRIVIVMFSLFSATAADGHLGLPSHIN